MGSNLQIFIVGLPILIIVGQDPVSSFFVRSVIIWMNDFVVVTLIFGNLIYSVHFDKDRKAVGIREAVGLHVHNQSSADCLKRDRSRANRISKNDGFISRISS